jgi:hypothetical protein
MPTGSIRVEVIAFSMCVRAGLYDSAAAKEIREVTEGKIANLVDGRGAIDYSAGRSAKELLMAKLEPR